MRAAAHALSRASGRAGGWRRAARRSRHGSSRTRAAAIFSERVRQLGISDFSYAACPTVFWDILGAVAKSAAHAMGTQLGRQIIRGVLGSLLGGTRRR